MHFIQQYERVITWIMEHADFGADKLVHTWVGLAIWVLAGLPWRRGYSRWLAFWVVTLAEAGNEVIDYIHAIGWTAKGTVEDIVATLFWPLVLTLVMRWKR